MRRPRPGQLWRYACGCLGLKAFFKLPGDGRIQPRIPAKDLVWSQVIGQILRESSFSGIESLVHSPGRKALKVSRKFGDDSLAYFSRRQDPDRTRKAIATAGKAAKRNKAFSGVPFIGLAIDGTGAGHTKKWGCKLCRPIKNAAQKIIGYHHCFCLATIVGTGITLPLDVEPYGPGDSEYASGQRLLERVVEHLGRRFLDYVVVDGEYATAPFLHKVGDQSLHVVARLKENLPELLNAAQARFSKERPCLVADIDGDRVEFWDSEDFDPWETLRWKTVRVIRYRQHKPDGTVVEAYWLTDWPISVVRTKTLFKLAKSRWEVENQGFNEAKNRHGLEHICCHDANSLIVQWLLILLALVIERLFRQRFLHRGTHPILPAIQFVRQLRLSLGVLTWDPG